MRGIEALDDIHEMMCESPDEYTALEHTMMTALRGVVAMHKPMRIYDECDHPHQDGDEGVIDTGEFLTCEEAYLYSICTECCVENRDYPEQAEWCADKHDHRKVGSKYCLTVAKISAALEEER